MDIVVKELLEKLEECSSKNYVYMLDYTEINYLLEYINELIAKSRPMIGPYHPDGYISPEMEYKARKRLEKENEKLKKRASNSYRIKQQKKFIKWLENETNLLAREVERVSKNGSDTTGFASEILFREVNKILLKCKEIIGDDNESI